MSSERLKLEVQLSMTEKILGPMKHVMGASKQTAAALKAARDQLKDLNDQQKRIDAWRKTDKDLAIVRNGIKGAETTIKALKAEIAKVPAPTRDMARALKAAQEEARTLKSRAAGLTEKQQRLRTELNASGMSTKDLATHQRALKERLDAATAAVDRETAAMRRQNMIASKLHAGKANYAKVMGMASKLRAAGGAAMMAGAAVNAAAAVPVLAYAKAEDSATQLKIAMMQAGGVVSKEFGEINDLANRLGNKLPGTTSDFQDMMTMLVRQGMPAKNILGGLGEATAYLSVQLKMVPTDAAEFASKLQDATRTADKDMMGLMDTIQKTFYLGVDQGNMLAGFSKLSPALSILKKEGAEAAQVLAPLLVMADQAGMAGEAAGNAYRKIFQMSLDKKKLGKGNDELEGTGIKLDFSDGKGEFGGLEKMYAQLAKLRGVDTQRRLAALKKIFGDDAETLQALALMIEKGVGGYRDVQAKMAAQASLQERVTAQLGTLKNLWDAASGTFTNLLVALGESIAPELHATAEWMGKLAERAQTWAKANPELSGTLMTVMKWAGLLTVGAGGLLIVLGALAVPIAATSFVLGAFGTTAGGAALATWAFLKPLLLVAGAAYAGWQAGKLLSAGIDALLPKVFGAGTTLGTRLYDIVQQVKSFPGEMMTLGGQMIDGLIEGFQQRFPRLTKVLKWMSNMMPGTVRQELDIKSPSRVFAEIGGFTMEGLEQGILRGQDGPLAALARAAKGVTAAGAGMLVSGAAMALPALDTRPPLGLGGGGSSGGNTYVFQIYPSPGMDANDLAGAIERKLRQIDAERAARVRSRLFDMD